MINCICTSQTCLGYLVRNIKNMIRNFTFPKCSYWHLAEAITRKMCSELHLVMGLSRRLFPPLLHITSVLADHSLLYLGVFFRLFTTHCINGDLYILLPWVCRPSSFAGIRIEGVKRWPSEICSFYANACPSGNRKYLYYLPDVFLTSKEKGS